MHDPAVAAANFTECVPAPTGEGCGVPVIEGGWARSQPTTLQRQPRGVGSRLRWDETCEPTLASRQSLSDLDGV
jgi:hypothetical protein